MSEITLDRIDANANYVWTDARVVQQCTFEDGRVDGGLAAEVGDLEDGVWLVWFDDVLDRDGRPYSLLKTTLVRSDGSFAW